MKNVIVFHNSVSNIIFIRKRAQQYIKIYNGIYVHIHEGYWHSWLQEVGAGNNSFERYNEPTSYIGGQWHKHN